MSKVIIQMILQGTAVFSKAILTAYQQALHNAKSGGVSAVGSMTRLKMSPDEAVQILNIDKKFVTRKAVEEQYLKFFDMNDPSKGGSFYLQSKVFRARESLINQMKDEKNSKTNDNNSQQNSDQKKKTP